MRSGEVACQKKQANFAKAFKEICIEQRTEWWKVDDHQFDWHPTNVCTVCMIVDVMLDKDRGSSALREANISAWQTWIGILLAVVHFGTRSILWMRHISTLWSKRNWTSSRFSLQTLLAYQYSKPGTWVCVPCRFSIHFGRCTGGWMWVLPWGDLHF